MKTYSLITKPYKIRLKPGYRHNMTNPLTTHSMEFAEGTELWCAKAYSQDHVGYKSLFIFNHSFFTTVAPDNLVMIKKWEITDSQMSWRDSMSDLQRIHLALNMFVDGTVPKFVPKVYV